MIALGCLAGAQHATVVAGQPEGNVQAYCPKIFDQTTYTLINPSL